MALPDLTDIRTEVRQRIGFSTTDTSLTDTVLTALINAANRKQSLIHDWPWLVTTDATLTATVSGTRIYTPATNWRKTQYIITDGAQQLKVKQPQDIWRFADVTGSPQFYSVQGGSIIIAPTPDAVYTIDHIYIKNVTALSSDTDEPDSPMWALDLLIEGAAVLAAKRLKDPELARAVQQEYMQTLVTLQDEVRRTRQLPVPQHRTDIGWP